MVPSIIQYSVKLAILHDGNIDSFCIWKLEPFFRRGGGLEFVNGSFFSIAAGWLNICLPISLRGTR